MDVEGKCVHCNALSQKRQQMRNLFKCLSSAVRKEKSWNVCFPWQAVWQACRELEWLCNWCQARKLYCLGKVNSTCTPLIHWSALKFPFENRKIIGLVLDKRLLILLNIPMPLIGHCPVVNCSSKSESVSWNSWHAALFSVWEDDCQMQSQIPVSPWCQMSLDFPRFSVLFLSPPPAADVHGIQPGVGRASFKGL